VPEDEAERGLAGVSFGAFEPSADLTAGTIFWTTDEKSRFRMKRITAAFVSRHDKDPRMRGPISTGAKSVRFSNGYDSRQLAGAVRESRVAATI
jgi:hypothetical protein